MTVPEDEASGGGSGVADVADTSVGGRASPATGAVRLIDVFIVVDASPRASGGVVIDVFADG